MHRERVLKALAQLLVGVENKLHLADRRRRREDKLIERARLLEIQRAQNKTNLKDADANGKISYRIGAYMQMKKDGHIKFYTKEEWLKLGELTGLQFADSFETQIRFPKKKENAPEFDEIIHRFDQQVIAGYDIEITESEIWITEKVNNLLFQKRNGENL